MKIFLANTSNDIEEIVKNINEFDIESVKKQVEGLFPAFLNFLINLAVAVLILLIGWKVISVFRKWCIRSMDRLKVDHTVSVFYPSCISVVLFGLLIFAAADRVGISSASLLALLGSAGIAISLALQDSLSNFAGGVMILMVKPFVAGDYIICQSGEGTVKNIGLIYTTLITVDNKQVVIPNGILSGSPLTNVTAQDKRRLIISIGIGYDSDLKKAKEIMERLFREKNEVLKDEAIDVYVDDLGESSILLTARGWTRTEDYWKAKWALTEEIKLAFDKAKIEIPYNKLDINIVSSASDKDSDTIKKTERD